jgi:uncharacterized protein (DUF697 family)
MLGPLIALARAGMAPGSAVARRISKVALFGMLGGFAAIAAVGFSLSALWIAVLPRVGPAGASLILAGVLAVLGFFLLAMACIIFRRDRQKTRSDADVESSLLAVAELFKEHKGAMVLAALVAGLSAGAGSRGSAR